MAGAGRPAPGGGGFQGGGHPAPNMNAGRPNMGGGFQGGGRPPMNMSAPRPAPNFGGGAPRGGGPGPGGGGHPQPQQQGHRPEGRR
jgi:hypothetical protein